MLRLFRFSAENSSLLLVRLFRRSGGRRISLWFCCRFHLKDKLRRHIVMQLNGDLVLASNAVVSTVRTAIVMINIIDFFMSLAIWGATTTVRVAG